ncbi:hypothetical protein [Neisseria montereyensis]|uniref:Uncharacterized protein n=1 Tax=Neisseria montereyensis TaxID=2973938 RepID=A0ABT2FAT3_9NEIS|nr:hypothetical protein [Neisseria montereyensis]MCS4533272.1 hypothetical protein [Neisseria montereyensis]
MRPLIFILALSLLPAAASAADQEEKRLINLSEAFEIGKPEQRIRRIVYQVAEQSNTQDNVRIYRQTDKFSGLGWFSSAPSVLKRKSSSVTDRPDSESLVLLNHWDLQWKMNEAGFTTRDIQIAPPPAQWSLHGATVESAAVLEDANGTLNVQEKCTLAAAANAQAIHSSLKGNAQHANCTLTMKNPAGTVNLTQNFEGYYLYDYQMFIPRIVVQTNHQTNKTDRLDYQIESIR